MSTRPASEDRLIEQARQIGRHRTKKEAVTAALREYVRQRRRLEILGLVGGVEYWDDYNPKALRRQKRS
jgi:Arc/MetJ family transcription regulator